MHGGGFRPHQQPMDRLQSALVELVSGPYETLTGAPFSFDSQLRHFRARHCRKHNL